LISALSCGLCSRKRAGNNVLAMSVDANQQTFAKRLSEARRSPSPVSVWWIVSTIVIGIGVSVAATVVVAVTCRRIAVAKSRVAAATTVKDLCVDKRLRIRKRKWR
jgi:hypothetical protein